MKKNTAGLLSLVLGAFLLLWTSCKPSDSKITEEVTAKVAAISPSVSVAVKDGVVSLSGEVSDNTVRLNVESAAKEVKGVKSVNNGTIVATPVPAPAPVVINNDPDISAAIMKGLEDKHFKDITVTVKDGEVTLTGNVKKSDLATVMQIANESNPKKVINQMTIK